MHTKHHIDDNNQVIITRLEGEPDDAELVSAFKTYLTEIKHKPEYFNYDEILDLTAIKGINLSSDGLKLLGAMAAESDGIKIHNKCAIITSSTLTYGLSRMYEVTRSLHPGSHKSIQTFNNKQDALNWLDLPDDLI